MAVQLIEWQLDLARTEVTQKVLPWQKPLASNQLTPNRVIQSLPGHLSQVGTPALRCARRNLVEKRPAGPPEKKEASRRSTN